ncbi:hypothetical protein [Aquipuribacter hungaricus]|uniref:Fido domain-containing protein n=1 Tax=Aquipuribacter hungaricus TaxID=545624 RepID=A0ABV7WLX0_9MICO
MPGPDPLAALAARPAVAEAVDRAREACTELRWHPALRRRTAEVRTESCVRAAAASAELEGVRLPLAQVRAVVVPGGVAPAPDAAVDTALDPAPGPGVAHGPGTGTARAVGPVDAVDALVRGALRATLDTADLAPRLARAPAQVLARLHTLAAADLVAAAAPRGAGRDLPAAEASGALAAAGRDGLGRPSPGTAGRVQALVALLAGGTDAPGLVLAAVAEAELTTTGAFAPAGGVVARALARTVVVASGLDPHGVVVMERHALADRPGREQALAGYAAGTAEGVEAWVVWWGDAVVAGAAHGRRVADEVMAGRLA